MARRRCRSRGEHRCPREPGQPLAVPSEASTTAPTPAFNGPGRWARTIRRVSQGSAHGDDVPLAVERPAVVEIGHSDAVPGGAQELGEDTPGQPLRVKIGVRHLHPSWSNNETTRRRTGDHEHQGARLRRGGLDSGSIQSMASSPSGPEAVTRLVIEPSTEPDEYTFRVSPDAFEDLQAALDESGVQHGGMLESVPVELLDSAWVIASAAGIGAIIRTFILRHRGKKVHIEPGKILMDGYSPKDVEKLMDLLDKKRKGHPPIDG